MSYRYILPVHNDHVGIMIGNKFSTLNNLNNNFSVNVHYNSAEPLQNRPLPSFVVVGKERNVHLCIIEIQRLVIISMTNYIKRIKNEQESSYAYMKMRVDTDSGIVLPESPCASI